MLYLFIFFSICEIFREKPKHWTWQEMQRQCSQKYVRMYCALCLCGLCSRALVNQGKMSCSKFQLSAGMKRKDLDLDEKMKVIEYA